jgi:two-component system, OmpR family, response regulator MprA
MTTVRDVYTISALPGDRSPGRAGDAPVVRRRSGVILVVVQERALRDCLVNALRVNRVVVDRADDGVGALLALAHRTPDAVILDIGAGDGEPVRSGQRVYQVLRQCLDTRRVPVIMLSEASREEVCARPEEGPPPDSFLQKPVEADAVLAALVGTVRTGAVTRPRGQSTDPGALTSQAV